MFKYLPSFLGHRTSRNTIIVFCGGVLSSCLGLLSVLIVGRELGAANFGVFFFSLTIMLIISELVGSCVNITFIRFYAASIEEEAEKSNWVLKIALWATLIAGVLISSGCIILAEPIAVGLLNKPEAAIGLRFAGFGCFGLLMWGFVVSILHARQLFGKSAVLQIGYNCLRVGFVLVVLFCGILNLVNCLIAYLAAVYLSIFIGSLFLPRGLWHCGELGKEAKQSVVWEFFHFNKWILLSSVLYIVHSRVGFLLLFHFKDLKSVGFYSGAASLVMGIDLVTRAFHTVLLPVVSKFSRAEEYSHFIKRFSVLAVPLCVIIGFLAFAISRPLVITIYKSEFAGAIAAFKILVLGSLLTLIAAPLSLTFYAMNKPQFLTCGDFVALAAGVILGLLVVPRYGVMGAAVTTLITRSVTAFCVFVFLYVKVYRRYAVKGA